MGCLLAEFKLTAMLFGGGRRGRDGGRAGGGRFGLVAAAFWGFSPLHSPPLLTHSRFPLESREEENPERFSRPALCCQVVG